MENYISPLSIHWISYLDRQFIDLSKLLVPYSN